MSFSPPMTAAVAEVMASPIPELPVSPKSKLRVLVLAEAANPEWVSVPLVGWSHSKAVSSVADSHLVTQIRNRDAILREGLVEGRDFTSINSELVAKLIWRFSNLVRGGKGKGWTTVTSLAALSYPYFEHLVWKQFGRRIRDREFDLVHRITPVSPAIHSPMARWCHRAGVPFILGPINGGVPWPKGFERERHREKEWLSYVRGLYRLMPGYRSTLNRASAIIVGSYETWRQIPQRYRSKCFYLPENAIDPSRFHMTHQRAATKPIKVIFVGRLVPLKAVDILIKAAAPLIKSGHIDLEIIGDGEELPSLRQLARDEQVESYVRFAGWVEHHRLQGYLAQADVFAFPSIREFGGGVVLEAMAVGLMPIVIAYGGPGETVREATGYLLKMATKAELVLQLRAVLAEIADNPAIIDVKSRAAEYEAREHFSWQAKACQVLQIYRWVLAPRGENPNFAMPLADRVMPRIVS
jgi:glycosyltransferase involved in cell wall biosynthesis